MSNTLNFMNKLNEGIEGVKKPNKIINEAAEDIKEYRYITNHGIGPGTVPKGTYVRSEDLDSGKTAIYLNRPLSNEELNKYDIKPENIQENTKPLTEDENNGKVIYMNTWANYNENGADLSKYGIEDGWMTIEEAKDFANQHEEDEPFINDVDIELPFEVNEYSNVGDTLDQIDDYMLLDDSDKEVISAIIEATGYDYDEAKDIYDSGDYIYYSGIDNDYDLGYEIAESYGVGSISGDLLERYFDYEALGRDIRLDYYQEEDLPETAGEYWAGDENATDEEIGQAYVDNVGFDGVSNSDNYFDYESFGRDNRFDGFTYTDTGAIQVS